MLKKYNAEFLSVDGLIFERISIILKQLKISELYAVILCIPIRINMASNL